MNDIISGYCVKHKTTRPKQVCLYVHPWKLFKQEDSVENVLNVLRCMGDFLILSAKIETYTFFYISA